MKTYPTTTTLYFGPWYRRSPFFDGTQRAGCKAYDIYNKMYLPAEYDDPAVEYRALQEGVTLWDVGVERTVQISGPDADRLVDLLTCRDLTRCAVKQCKYMLVTAPHGGIVNDPVLVHPEENVWWMQLADSDAGLYALGVLASSGLDAQVTLPDVHPVQVQGPKAVKTLQRLVGDQILDLKYYWCGSYEIQGIPVVISRTGWTAIPGFEVNLLDFGRGDELWDAILAAGEEFNIRAIAPCEARRIEAGIFNYGSDIRVEDTPLHVTGLEKYVEWDQEAEFLGRGRLEEIRDGHLLDRKLVGIEIGGDPMTDEGALYDFWTLFKGSAALGRITAGAWSPRLEKNIGYAWVPIRWEEPGSTFDAETPRGRVSVTVVPLPFVDPSKDIPKG